MARPKPRKWIPKNPDKYIGDVNNIISRSSWETRLLNWLDASPSVLCYNSEEFIVPYISPIDGRPHRYFVDFLAKVKTRSGIKTYAIEVKPQREMVPPVQSKNKKKMLTETTTYLVNQAKWEAARAICKQKGIEFIVLNENDLGIK